MLPKRLDVLKAVQGRRWTIQDAWSLISASSLLGFHPDAHVSFPELHVESQAHFLGRKDSQGTEYGRHGSFPTGGVRCGATKRRYPHLPDWFLSLGSKADKCQPKLAIARSPRNRPLRAAPDPFAVSLGRYVSVREKRVTCTARLRAIPARTNAKTPALAPLRIRGHSEVCPSVAHTVDMRRVREWLDGACKGQSESNQGAAQGAARLMREVDRAGRHRSHRLRHPLRNILGSFPRVPSLGTGAAYRGRCGSENLVNGSHPHCLRERF